ncbi:MAG: winged helix-turn-helix transcriptional regulator, partial [Sciscionella sp.]|nr:winged helix-turn-helix transcriptional regulator [Sciscionella sp.]
MRQHLQHDITRRGLVMSRHGPLAMLAGLSPNIRIDATDVVIAVPARSGTDTEQIELALGEQDEILLVPSHFTWPEVNMLIHKDCIAGREHTTVLIQYALAAMRHAGEAPVPPATLLTMLRAIADPTRMQILQLIVGQARSTREIAGLIGITEAAISKHLKLLQDAGW